MARILFVDDDADFTSATKSLLKAEAHDVHVAGSLQQAQSALERGAFDMLFVDLSSMECLPPLNTDFFTQLQRDGVM